MMLSRGFLLVALLSFASISYAQEDSTSVVHQPGLVCFWDFQQQADGGYVSTGTHAYVLKPQNGPIAQAEQGIFGTSLNIRQGQWLLLPREDCPALNFRGKDEVTIVAWIERASDANWQYIAGMWNERDAKRQYALFTCAASQTNFETMDRIPARHQTHGYASDVGGATPGKPFCFSYASGATKLAKREWTMIAYTYDHEFLRVYVDGKLDEHPGYNPFPWNKPIFDAGDNGADFTVARQCLPNWPHYPKAEKPMLKQGFGGKLAGLAVYRRALSSDELETMYQQTLGNREND
ncbi:LamG-like jellyroll fold domain-containing protein [Bremerella sp. JC770]|uniref:LamG-like jellyroll fold domain-containing protein n=1 Tax=Bremerella sp. JC770 TaxID=3232137 RepID=UPI00345884B8